jgi:glucose/arabinose dehydrogenase
MTTFGLLVSLLMTVLMGAASPQTAAVQLEPVVSGLSSPLFAGHAGDGSNRLFIVEQAGMIWVLAPGSSTKTVFLDIRPKVLAGGERGLLGLAFHPQYAATGRFFVYYTRAGDGALVVAGYTVSPNPNVANGTETVLLTIPHPTNANHNGGMLAFGPDGYLYIGVGDGGSANDPPNNAQNVNVLLGKILRIDVNPPAGSTTPYVSPPSNPFFGSTPGLDEIFAIGLRNPWRFSFDRLTGSQWVADVGQSAREEVDAPILSGGNYGWRVYEGTQCTNSDPALCNPANYLPPIFEYAHSGGRCSITGGYVYRGSQGTLPSGTYVYGDYCSGEIFTWDGSQQNVLLSTGMNISSFGEDESGELYVVNLGGSVSRLVQSGTAACTYSISPTRVTFTAAGGTGSVAVAAGPGCGWSSVSQASWIAVTSGATGSGNGTVTYSVARYTGRQGVRNGTVTIAGQNFTVKQTR